MAKKTKETTKLQTLNDIPEESFISTGIDEIDEVLGGGFPRRRITQIWGVPGVGKSYLLGKTMAKLDGKCLYIDSEFALNKSRMEQIGVNMAEVNYYPCSQLEEVANFVVDNINDYDLVIIDTLAKLTPMAIDQNDVGTQTIALAARQIAHFEAKLRPKLYKSKAAVVGINQARANMGMGQAESKPAGGFAWNHTVDLSLKLARTGNITKQVKGETIPLGHWTKLKVDKSRVSVPYVETKFKVDYGVET